MNAELSKVIRLPRTPLGRRYLLCALAGGASDIWESPDDWGIDWDIEAEGVEEAAAQFGSQPYVDGGR
jgi:hypothetical protein